MTGELTPFTNFGLDRDSRRTARSIARSRSHTDARIAGIDDEGFIAHEKLAVITTATGDALGSVSRVAELAKALELANPDASGRIAFLVNQHVSAMGEVLQQLNVDLRRR